MSSLQSINNENNNLIVTGNKDDEIKYNNSVAIRQEIQRFESVHPSIYAIYDLLELNSDQVLSLRIREHLLSIEESFVNSHEWTISRNVPQLRLGIAGNLNSCKSDLVHRYLTGSYMQDESAEGGRFKNEVVANEESNLLMIRDEGGAPGIEFSNWVDGVIFVFSSENMDSFKEVEEYYEKFSKIRKNLDDFPLFLVATQENDSNCNRVINEYAGRNLAKKMNHNFIYYETCLTSGRNIEKVFQDACQRIIQTGSRGESYRTSSMHNDSPSYLLNLNQTNYNTYLPCPSTPNATNNNNYMLNIDYCNNGQINKQPSSPLSTFNYQSPVSNQQKGTLNNSLRKSSNTPINKNLTRSPYGNLTTSLSASKAKEDHIFVNPVNPISQSAKKLENNNIRKTNDSRFVFTPISNTTVGIGQSSIMYHNTPTTQNSSSITMNTKQSLNNIETPTTTPKTNRKARRRSNLFSSSKNKNLEEKSRNGELGSGRTIPIRQGYLHKKSVKSSLNTKLSLKNKEWKKKYVTLTTDGSLTYYSSLHDYMDDAHGKKISLMHTTVKIPGQKPRGTSIVTQNQNAIEGDFNRLNLLNKNNNNNQINCNKSLINESCIDGGNLLNDRCVNCGSLFNSLDDRKIIQNTNSSLKDSSKKKHRRHKSNQLPLTSISTTNAYCERCANLLDNGNNGFTFASNNNCKDSTNGNNEEDDFVFVIVSLDNKQWHFQAQSADDRELWIQAIEDQILLLLTNIQSDKEKLRNNNSEQSNNEKIFRDRIRQIPGNNYCLDCDATNPTWASLNLGGLICIECSGIHRNLGTHISKVRSLDLDDWSQGNISVMLALGNSAVNKIWEYDTKNLIKPVPTSSRDDKESWIRKKYEQKEFLLPLNNQTPIVDQLTDSISAKDVRKVFQILSQISCNQTLLNEFKFNGNQRSTALQLAVSTNDIAITQLIIWSNGNVNAVDNYGKNALSYAKSKDMQEFLKSQGCTDITQLDVNIQLSSNNSNITDFSFKDKTLRDNLRDNSSKSTQMSNLVTSDVFDKLPTSII